MPAPSLIAGDAPGRRLGLGLAAVGRPGYINLGHGGDLGDDLRPEALERRAWALLDAAWEGGVRLFDVARSYGRAEAFLAGWLRARDIPPEAVVVTSKWGYAYTAQWRVEADTHEVKEHSLAQLERQWSESRELLGPWLDLYQIHSATLESGVLDNREVLAELVRLKRQGIDIGLTVSGARQGEVVLRALGLQIDGEPLFDTVQATWNLLERSAERALAAAADAGLAVIVKEALANGRLTDRNREPEFGPALARLRAQGERLGAALDALALAAALARPWAAVVLSGAANEAQLRSNLGATAVAWDAEAEAALAPLVEPAERYWQRRGELPWN